MKECPTLLPPGFQLRPTAHDPWCDAMAAADEVGSVFCNGAAGRCRAAFVFAPDRPADPATLRDLGLLALFEAIASLAPPQSPVSIAAPDGLLVDGGLVATVRAAAGLGEIPDWAVLGLEVAVDLRETSPGERPAQTCLAEEGFGAVTTEDVLESTCRQLLGWIDRWREEGPALLAATVQQRTSPVAIAV